MYLQQLKSDADQLVVNSHDQYVVLTPSGAVFHNFFTEDLRNVCIAFARLFDGDWRAATTEEFKSWIAKPADHPMLIWTQPPPPEPLRLVK